MRPRPKDNRKRNGGHSKMKNMNRIKKWIAGKQEFRRGPGGGQPLIPVLGEGRGSRSL